jgi:hypothetical protein
MFPPRDFVSLDFNHQVELDDLFFLNRLYPRGRSGRFYWWKLRSGSFEGYAFHTALDATPESLKRLLPRSRAQTMIVAKASNHGGDNFLRQTIQTGLSFPGSEHSFQAPQDSPVVISPLGFQFKEFLQLGQRRLHPRYFTSNISP